MKLLISDEEIDEKPIVVESNDRGKVIIPTVGEHGKHLDELTKEIIANDAIEVGVTKAATIHGVNPSSASRYTIGEGILDPDTKSRILTRKHGIADLATTKLMETLGMFDPSGIEKQTEIVRAAKDLASIAESMSSQNKNSGNGEIHLHMYSPKQRPLSEFTVIDV